MPTRPALQCDCSLCRDDSITVCLEEANRLLQIDYDEVETFPVGDPRAEPETEPEPQRSLTDF